MLEPDDMDEVDDVEDPEDEEMDDDPVDVEDTTLDTKEPSGVIATGSPTAAMAALELVGSRIVFKGDEATVLIPALIASFWDRSANLEQ